MICVPLDGDQPLVAFRVADELQLGIKLDHTKMNANDIRRAIHKLLSEKAYYERVQSYSIISKKNSGCLTGPRLILDLLEKRF
jgi:UDP:flavonoid glycosyltransferase YjiC (YdhE family)